MEVLVSQSCPTLATPWTVAHQALLSMEFSGKNAGVGCHFLFQGIFPTQGSNPSFLHLLAVGFFTTGATWEVYTTLYSNYVVI